MATSGHRTPAVRRFAERGLAFARAVGACLAIALAGGCATGTMEVGRPPPTDRLSQLQPGVSTRDEVLKALGEPQGRGAGRLPSAPLQDLLLYESDVTEGTRMKMKMLIVFVNRSTGIYEGYLWFQSGLKTRPG
jgi:hypothetical protein